MVFNLFSRQPQCLILSIEVQDARTATRIHGEAFARAWGDGEFPSLLYQPNTFGFVALQTNTLIFKAPLSGFVLAREVAGEAEILTIAVSDKFARFGLGWRLMQAALREAKLRGGESMFLEVDDGNQAALGLYRKLGFEKAGERPAYYMNENGRRSSALVMRRDLR